MGPLIELQKGAVNGDSGILASTISLFACAGGHKASSASFWACA